MTEPDTEPDLCVCAAHALETLLPMLRQASAAFAEVRQVIPTLAELNRRLAVLEQCGDYAKPATRDIRCTLPRGHDGMHQAPQGDGHQWWESEPDGHVHVFVDGFDRCSWCGVER